MIDFVMPTLGADMDEGTLDEWRVKPGDAVTRGQIVAVVETTRPQWKSSAGDGVVQELLVPVGQTVAVGTPLATLLEPGESPGAPSARPSRRGARPRRNVSGACTARAVRTRRAPAVGVTGRPPDRGHPRRGPQGADRDRTAGAITLRDVEHAAATAHHEKPAPPPTPAAGDRGAEVRGGKPAARRGHARLDRRGDEPLKREIPHYYLANEIILDPALAWLTEQNAGRPITERLLPAVLQLKAVALAARKFPEFNGFWRDDGFQPAAGQHVGVAISLRGGGLVAPAIHDVSRSRWRS